MRRLGGILSDSEAGKRVPLGPCPFFLPTSVLAHVRLPRRLPSPTLPSEGGTQDAAEEAEMDGVHFCDEEPPVLQGDHDSDSDVLLEIESEPEAEPDFGEAVVQLAGEAFGRGQFRAPALGNEGPQESACEGTERRVEPAQIDEDGRQLQEEGMPQNHFWGPFRFTLKKEVDRFGVAKVAWECHCPFHALNRKSGCKKSRVVRPQGEDKAAERRAHDVTLKLLRHWASRAPSFDRQRHHMSAGLVHGLQDDVELSPPDAPTEAAVPDDVLDNLSTTVTTRAEPKPKPKASGGARASASSVQVAAADAARSSSSSSSESSDASSGSSSESSSSS